MELPLIHPLKTLKAVVATICLGVGVDVGVKGVLISFSLGATDTVQEAGRCMRGSNVEIGDEQGYAYFFQKGS